MNPLAEAAVSEFGTLTARTLIPGRATILASGFVVLVLAGAAQAEPLFKSAFLAADVKGSVSFVATADLNADGLMDIVATSQYPGTVRVSVGLGDGAFAPASIYGVSQGGSQPVIADLTGDGILDIAIADSPNTSIGVLPGIGNGTFGDTIQVATGFQCYTMAVADLNGDTKPDLVVANWTSVGTLLGNGDGTFGVMNSFPTATNVYRLAVGHLNGDGHPDVVTVGDYAQVSVLFGIGNGALQPYQGFVVSGSITDVEVADATGNGVADVVIGLQAGVSIFPSNGDGTFQPRVDVTFGSSLHGRIDVGDINGDTHPDIVSTPSGSPYYPTVGPLTVLLGDGIGGFPIRHEIESVYSMTDVDLADLDGDDKLDLVAASASGLVALHFGNGDGTFGTARRYATGADPVAVALGDLDGDSEADLVVAHRGSASISVRRGNGDGTFGIRRDYDSNLIVPTALALGDLDGDGHADVAVADAPGAIPGTAGVRVFRGYANGNFAGTGSYPTGYRPSGIAIGDLDGDGARDLVVTDETANRASVLLNSGGGSFLPPVHYGAGAGATGVAIGDLNGDQHLDVVTANRQGGSVTILLGAGDGSFTSEIELATASDCRAVTIGRVNADAIPDLVTANGVSNTLSVLIGQGGGQFAPPTVIETGSSPASVAIAQLDGDGLPDLVAGLSGAVPSSPVNYVVVALASGGGAFKTPLLLGCEDGPEAVAVADLDGSGGQDIVTANRTSESVSVLMHTGSSVVAVSRTESVEFRLGYGYPNPSPASVAVRYALPHPAEAALRVYDAGGRLVRVLADGLTPAGEHVVQWDRRTDRGGRAAPGVYFCELRALGRRIAQRIVLL